MTVDGLLWRNLREEFQSLQGHVFILIWSSRPPLNWQGVALDQLLVMDAVSRRKSQSPT